MRRMKHRLGTLVVVGLLAACGSSDEEPASGDETTDDASTTVASDDGETTSADDMTDDMTDDGDDDLIVIDDFDDIPDECFDLMADFLREIEPSVSDIDWENVTIEELTAMDTALDVPTDDFDRRSQETGCDRYDIGADTDQSLEFAIQVAEREAPGTVGWLQFISDMSAVGDVVDDVTSDADGPPADCDGMKQYLLELADEYGTFNNVPAGAIGELTMAIGNLSQACTIGELEEIYQDPVIQAFLDG